MSGIVGAFHFDKAVRLDPAVLDRAHQAIEPWGVDGGGTANVAGCGLGQRHRSLDEAHGDGRPMWDAERRLLVVVDGALQRREELRAELERDGHRFRGLTQAELVLAAYRQWGVDCVNHLTGGFAFAVFDRRTHSLFLARDRLGHRPLFVYRDAHRLCFASGTQGVLSQGGIPVVLDPEAAEDYLSLGFFAGGRSPLRNIDALAPGSAVYADPHVVRQWSYWEPVFAADRAQNLEQRAQALLTLLEARAEDPGPDPVLSLSGGLGAATIAAVVSRRWSTPAPSVTVRDLGGDEARAAADTARAVGLPGHGVFDPSDPAAAWTALVNDGEPPVDGHAVWWLALGQTLSGHGRTAWTGVGTDVIFGAGARYRPTLQSHALRGRLLGPVEPWIKAGARAVGISADGLERQHLRRCSATRHRAWYTQDFLRGLRGYDAAERWSPADDGEGAGPLARLQSMDLTQALPYATLAALERVERHAGVRWVHPFVDGAVVDFACSLPDRYRLDVDHDRVVLQRAARRVLPPQIVQRPSLGVRPSVGDWMRGPLKRALEPLLFDPSRTGLFDPKALRRAWYQLLLGRTGPAVSLWRTAMLEAWIRRVVR